MAVWMRRARTGDLAAIIALNDAAFKSEAEGRIASRLHADGDSLLSLVAHDEAAIVGHLQFFRIQIDGAAIAAGLGPMSVVPSRQKSGIGAGLVRLGLTALEGAGETIVFVLGHPAYYPRFGFAAAAAAPFSAAWHGPAFMALRFGDGGPPGGSLQYPAAFGAG
jgi:putative acetyltransferase